MCRLLRVLGGWRPPPAQEPFEHIEPVGPEALVEAQPLVGAGERSGVEAAQVGAAADLATDQPGVLQHLDVLGGGRERDREGFCQLAHRSLAAREVAEHLPPRGIAEGMKHRAEHRVFLFNHMVEYTDRERECQPIG